MSPSLSCAVSVRRYALVPNRFRISDAQALSDTVLDGRHEKMMRRLGVSETPAAFCGPTMPRSMMCGGIVVPELAVPPDASDQSCGLIRSSYGPSPRLTNATDTRCGPAVIRSGSVRYRSTPSGRSCAENDLFT